MRLIQITLVFGVIGKMNPDDETVKKSFDTVRSMKNSDLLVKKKN
jgi:hypothetical protein